MEQIPPAATLRLRQAELYPDLAFEDLSLPEDEEGIHFGLFHQNQLIAVVSCFLKAEEMQFRKFATQKAFQHQGFGSALLKYIFEFAKAENKKKIWCNARSSATSFYKKFGMLETDQKFSKADIDYIIMEKELNNYL
ncbi:MAG: GNAT family N-acetyltransferase [Sphingobacteriales bacterium]|nr:GNAT family N-acetyltransferase [Sphingobacteriales bacterium]